jgi:hypothetical protein
MCWGKNNCGQVGIGSTVDQLSPVAVSLGSGQIVFFNETFPIFRQFFFRPMFD